MPKPGDSYDVELKEAHLSWGEYRHTSTRGVIYGEGYIKIPSKDARRLEIYNSNRDNVSNLYQCSSKDGYLTNLSVKASGSSSAGDPYAKQFQGSGDLQAFGQWYNHVNARVGDIIRVTWIRSNFFEVEKL